MANKKPKVLFYDLETSPLKAYIWSLGKQVVRHGQLDKAYAQYGIICVTYCWNNNKKAQSIDWGYEQQDTGLLVERFDEIINSADIVIGKNNNRFDNKMLNSARMFAGLKGMPEWLKKTDDLEAQMRRNFRLPSHSLDYISEQLGCGGKIKMEMQDWIDIVERTDRGEQALKKMLRYGKKDVEDTRSLWYKLYEHFTPKFDEGLLCCIECGSYSYRKSGINYTQQGAKQRYKCVKCGTRFIGGFLK